MSISALQQLLTHPRPVFSCANFDRTRTFDAGVQHVVNAPADVSLLQQIPDVPCAAAAQTFFALYDGAVLFNALPRGSEPSDGHRSGLRIFPIGEWATRTAEVVQNFETLEEEASAYSNDALDEDAIADESIGGEWPAEDSPFSTMPYGKQDFIAIAQPYGASNSIHWVVRGPAAGRIYFCAWTMPPAADDPPLASDFGEFLRLVCEEPVRFFNELTFAYTQFADEDGTIGWPTAYRPDASRERLP